MTVRLTLLVLAAIVAAPLAAQPRLIPAAAESAAPTPAAEYSDLAGLALAAPVVADMAIRAAARIKIAEAIGLAPGFARYYVTGEVVALIRGPAGLPVRLSWLADVPLDPRGRAVAPRKKARVLLFARTLAGRPTELQLIRPDAQRVWTPDADRITRAVLTEALAADAPPVVTGVANAFFVPGALPGEGETQIFLQTAGGRPVSISVVSDAGGQRRWSVALSEVVDAAAPPPRRDTLLWYRLACALPATLTDAAAIDDEPGNADRARADYAYVIRALGPCAVRASG